MLIRSMAVVATTILAASISHRALSQKVVMEIPHNEDAVRVKIRVLSSSIHAGTQNQDTYLAEMVNKSGDRQLINLIDVYAAEDSGLNRKALESLPVLRMKVTRSEFCDVVSDRFFVSPKSIIFDESAKSDLTQGASKMLRCYKLVRGSVHLKANDQID